MQVHRVGCSRGGLAACWTPSQPALWVKDLRRGEVVDGVVHGMKGYPDCASFGDVPAAQHDILLALPESPYGCSCVEAHGFFQDSVEVGEGSKVCPLKLPGLRLAWDLQQPCLCQLLCNALLYIRVTSNVIQGPHACSGRSIVAGDQHDGEVGEDNFLWEGLPCGRVLDAHEVGPNALVICRWLTSAFHSLVNSIKQFFGAPPTCC
mmetsp:Transcript_12069/g.31737  ORF Transcript_12069/g.31737 Transcript_12069/m.31737 type:complete len:206 (+) Transcript_12069:937-1554(+)